MADVQEFMSPFKYGHTIGKALQNTVGRDISSGSDGSITLRLGLPFFVSTSCGSVALAGTSGVTLVANGSVTGSRKVYVAGFHIKNSATDLAQKAAEGSIVLEDSSGTAFAYLYSTGSIIMKANAIAYPHSVGTIMLYSAFENGTGGGTSKGLQMRLSNGTINEDGQTIKVTVWGIIK